MNGYLPLFPLAIVAFPGEKLNLHVFESRYKQLLKDCLAEGKNFGIPTFVDNKIEYGTEVRVEDVVKLYPDGRADVTTRGVRVFRVLNYENPIEGKEYAGGEVEFIEDIQDDNIITRQKMHNLVKEFYETLELVREVEVADDLNSFDLGHKIGLSLLQEYELLKINRESERQNYIIEHLESAIPILEEVERTKQLIRMNGHFKNFDPLDF